MYKLFKIILLLSFCITNAQIHEIGGFAGGSNYIGDVGSTTYISPNKPVLGLFYKWNKSPRLAYRFALTGAYISGYDKNSKEPSRNLRGYNFTNSIKEVSLGLEFNFFDFNLHDPKRKFTPYVFSGLNYLRYHEAYVSTNINTKRETSGSLAIPIHLGVKTNVLPHFILAFEVGARYTLTDNLDGSNPKDESLLKFGNINNNDWYVFSGLTLSYTFGNKPCYCVD
ncbi:type IX secretion system protein PorG [Flavobacterium cellulosilyticum]|uniref:DUF6089 domain-containing protein n=1 Tax=Flavobacterium cellulosilyticum TaxID=2541731 RepID=A0A4R5CGV8_9FLAO|nr:DUF6089 family protein [Flavobacterium cellulosilyticum]TDD96502.1 hypothetical protein E0F76_10855 [Flavobacterium cellulosilyticum]